MAIPISPGVYTKIIDLSTYVQAVPGTIGFVCILSDRGPDNAMTFVGGQDEFFKWFGRPDITTFGKQYGQGPYIANNHLSVSNSLYVLRCLPEEAEFSNLFLSFDSTAFSPSWDSTAIIDSTSKVVITESLTMQNTTRELNTSLEAILHTGRKRICYFRPIGRGDWYNSIGIRLTENANPEAVGVYILDIYQVMSDGGEEVIESFSISFDQYALDDSGESMFIEDVVNRYSEVLKCKASLENIHSFEEKRAIYSELDYSDAFSSDPVYLDNGSLGTLVKQSDAGRTIVDGGVATNVLAQGYLGLLLKSVNDNLPSGEDDYCEEVTDLENIYYTIVYDAGYPNDVKTSVYQLVDRIRRDCVAILDNGDNPTFNLAMAEKASKHSFNSRYCAMYESYNKVYDVFTGRDIWVSPVYHMATLIPLNDMMYEIWYPVAGFNRATIGEIKELRYNPKLGQRDQMYLAQINPIVKFNVGYTVWGQLTMQARPSKLQDLHAMRTVLYIKRALEQYLKFFIFEFNDEQTWDAIKQDISPFLEYIRSLRGLKSFNVEVGATDYELKAKICHVNVMLEPTPIIEKIMLNLYIK